MKKLSLYKIAQRLGFDEDQIFFGLTILTGLIAGILAVFFHKSISIISEMAGTNRPFTRETFIYGGLLVGISGFLTTRYFSSSSGSGIPNVRLAMAVYHGNLSLKETIAKILTSVFSLSSGIPLGREGPTVRITSGIGSYLGQKFHLSKKKVKALVAVGSAGGIAAAFNTPISAVVFTLEEIVGDLNAKMLGSIVISSVIAAVTASVLHGNHPTFVHVNYFFTDIRELIYFVLVGVSASILGPIWVKSTLWIRKSARRVFRGHKLSVIMVSFIIVGFSSWLAPEVLGGGSETINDTLLSNMVFWESLAILFVFKFFLTALVYSTGVSGGLFMPTLLMGAILGSAIGLGLNVTLGEQLNIQAFALVGMGSFFAAVIRAPFTSILMIFELTRNYEIITPLMISNILAYAISSKIEKGSIYECISEQDGIHLPNKDDQDIMESLIIEDAMIKEVTFFNHYVTIKEALEKSKLDEYSGYPILKNGKIFGMVSTQDLARAYVDNNGSQTLEKICTKNLITVYPDQNLTVAFHKLQQFHISRLPVVSRLNDSNMLGLITAEDIVCRFGYHIQEENKEDEVTKIEEGFKEIKD